RDRDMADEEKNDETTETETEAAAGSNGGDLVADSEPAAPEEPAAPAEPAPPAPQSQPKQKHKRLPRPLRPKKGRRQRTPATERKAISREEKPDHDRGRRQERRGVVVSDAMDKTIVVKV